MIRFGGAKRRNVGNELRHRYNCAHLLFPGRLLGPKCFFTQAESKDNLPLQLCASLNSTIAQFFINLSGRANLGGGALNLNPPKEWGLKGVLKG